MVSKPHDDAVAPLQPPATAQRGDPGIEFRLQRRRNDAHEISNMSSVAEHQYFRSFPRKRESRAEGDDSRLLGPRWRGDERITVVMAGLVPAISLRKVMPRL